MSWIIAASTGAITTSPARTVRPHFIENIFSAIVAAIILSRYLCALQTYVVWQGPPCPGIEPRPYPTKFRGSYSYVAPCGLYKEK